MKTTRILICDDEELVRWSLKAHLEHEGFEVVEASDGDGFMEQVAKTAPAIALLDLKMPGRDGLACLRALREQGNDLPVVMLTAVGSVGPVVEATQLGAAAYMTKPFELDDVTDAVRKALDVHRARTTVTHHVDVPQYAGIIGSSRTMEKLFSTLRELESVDTPSVVITGESGTGKDLVARAIHSQGPRANAPFVEVDCTAIPENLMESTLFGHERGSFTDAKTQKKGLFEDAGGGVVFLDEIGELPLSLQAKLLRALENRTFKRVGGNRNIEFRASVLAATNRDLRGEVDAGRFREDLYYRLAVVELHVPPLRARRDDVPLLAEHFARIRSADLGKTIDGFTDEAVRQLQGYDWPGNVRELRNAVERLVIFQKDPIIGLEALPPSVRWATAGGMPDCPFLLPEDGVRLDDVEQGFVMQALERTDGNQSGAARLLGISRYALRNRMKKYGLL